MTRSLLCGLAAALLASPTFAQSSTGTWNDLPDRFQVDAGYFRISANTVLRYDGGAGGGGDIDFENDLGLADSANTFWIDASWRVGRRHQLKLGFTQVDRARSDFHLERDLNWGGQVYTAGLTTSAETRGDILGGYYRFAIVRNERFEIGPTAGVGYLWLTAGIRATGSVAGAGGSVDRTLDQSATTGSITGALGGYATAWLLPRLLVQGDFLYIRVSPDDSEASVTNWRLGANYYVFRNAGLGVQYKYDRFRYERGILVSELGGEITYKGLQVFLTFRF